MLAPRHSCAASRLSYQVVPALRLDLARWPALLRSLNPPHMLSEPAHTYPGLSIHHPSPSAITTLADVVLILRLLLNQDFDDCQGFAQSDLGSGRLSA